MHGDRTGRSRPQTGRRGGGARKDRAPARCRRGRTLQRRGHRAARSSFGIRRRPRPATGDPLVRNGARRSATVSPGRRRLLVRQRSPSGAPSPGRDRGGRGRHWAFLEISPHPIAHLPVRESLDAAAGGEPLVLPTLLRDSDEQLVFRTGLAALHTAGVQRSPDLLWPAGRRTALPTTPWRHTRHWADATSGPPCPPAGTPYSAPGSTCQETSSGSVAGRRVRERPTRRRIPGGGHFAADARRGGRHGPLPRRPRCSPPLPAASSSATCRWTGSCRCRAPLR